MPHRPSNPQPAAQRGRRAAPGPPGRTGRADPHRSGRRHQREQRGRRRRGSARCAARRPLGDDDARPASIASVTPTPASRRLDRRRPTGRSERAPRGIAREVLLDQTAEHLGEAARVIAPVDDTSGSQVTVSAAPSSPLAGRTARSRAGASSSGSRWLISGRRVDARRLATRSIARSHQAWTGQSPANRTSSARAQYTPSCSSTDSPAYMPTTTTRPPRRTIVDRRLGRRRDGPPRRARRRRPGRRSPRPARSAGSARPTSHRHRAGAGGQREASRLAIERQRRVRTPSGPERPARRAARPAPGPRTATTSSGAARRARPRRSRS